MAITRNTSRRRDQKINAQYVSTLQGDCSHRIRRKTATSKTTFFIFLFHSFRFYPFTTNVTRALPLEAIKGEVGATSKGGDQAATDRVHLNRNHTSRFHAPPLTKKTWDPLPFSKACNPYYEHSGARQHEPQRNPLDVEPFMPESVYILVSALHTIRA
jgi:hypothetical protein